MTTHHIAEVTDPITGDTTTLSAPTAPDLDQLVDSHLEQHYPNTQAGDPEGLLARGDRGRLTGPADGPECRWWPVASKTPTTGPS